MVETAEPQLRFQPSAIRFRFYRPSRWRVLLQSQVSPVVMIVTNEFAAEPSDVRLVDCDHMVEALAASGTDPSLRSPVLPGTPGARAHRLNGRGFQQVLNLGAEFGVAVQYGVLVRTHIWEGLTQLQAHPLGSRMGRYRASLRSRGDSMVSNKPQTADSWSAGRRSIYACTCWRSAEDSRAMAEVR